MYPQLFSTSGLANFAEAVDLERQAQLRAFGDQRHPDGTGREGYAEKADAARFACQVDAEEPGGPRWSLVLLEEVYEALAESDPAKLRAELVQVAAVCAAWISDLDRRPHPMRCAHCGEAIPTSEYRHTWVGDVSEPGQPTNTARRFHLSTEYPECRAASGAFGEPPVTPA
jgi:hypothetical protein